MTSYEEDVSTYIDKALDYIDESKNLAHGDDTRTLHVQRAQVYATLAAAAATMASGPT